MIRQIKANTNSGITILLTAFLMVCTSSCNFSDQNKQNGSLSSIMPKDKLILLLSEMQIVGAYVDQLRKNGIRTNDTAELYFSQVFEKYETTPAVFEESLLFYKEDLNELNEIYNSVIIRLNELKAKNEELQIMKDSILKDSILKSENWDSLQDSTKKSIFVNDSLNPNG
jgi:hypothetical protein